MIQRFSPSHPKRSDIDGNDSGVALIIVIAIMAMIAMQLVVFAASLRDAIRLTRVETSETERAFMLEAAIEVAAARLITAEPRERWAADGSPRSVTIAGTPITISITDERGKVALRRPDAVLVGLFRAVDIRVGQAQLKKHMFEQHDVVLSPADLVRIPGVTQNDIRRVSPHVTLYSTDGKINPELASETVLAALPGVGRQGAAQITALRKRGDQASIDALLAQAGPHLTKERGPAYRIAVSIGDKSDAAPQAEAIIALGLDGAAPFRILNWRIGPH